MQCASCEFQNMPGNTRCLRCGATLQLATAAVDVEPPRASSRSKVLRRFVPGSVTRTALQFRRSQAIEQWRRAQLPAGCLPRLAVPGWAQAYLGNRVQARRFFWSWLGLGLAGLLCYGSQLGAVWLGGMVAVHVGSIIDVSWRRDPVETQAQRGALAAALGVVALVAYGALLWNVQRVVDTRQWITVGEPFAPSDVVLYRQNAYAGAAPQPGDLVLFSNSSSTLGRTEQGHQARFQTDGQWVDRVIAGPGSRVRWESGALWVDDQASELRPLNPARMPQRLELTVPAGSYCVFPTTDPFIGPAEGTCFVPRGRIMGRAIARNYPPWRIWLLR
jgi:hypothetical protein